MVSDLLDVAYGKNPFIAEDVSDRFILSDKHPSDVFTFTPFMQSFKCREQLAVYFAFVMPGIAEGITKGIRHR